MKLAYFIKKRTVLGDPELAGWLDSFKSAGCSLYPVACIEDLQDGTDAIMAVGGDGTFLTAASIVAGRPVPILGVNRGRLGFLSENRPEDVLEPLLSGKYHIESREMLSAAVMAPDGSVIELPSGNFALNEISILRSGPGMIGVDVALDGVALPTYWADGVLVSTSSGSTAYNLSAGGPICLPDVKAHIVAPVAPHNLNVRPLITPSSSRITLVARDSRRESVLLSLDNRSFSIGEGTRVDIVPAPFATLVVRLEKSNFIEALKEKLFWGEDIRNTKR